MTLQPGSYRPTGDDRLWLLRAVAAEGAPQTQVAQALVNRFMWLRARAAERHQSPPYDELWRFVRAYAQPVNPRWMKGGDKFEEAWERADQAERQRLLLSDARRRNASSRDSFDDLVREAVDRALLLGPVDLARADTTDYGAPHRTTEAHLVQHTSHTRGVNTFYGARAAQGWPGYRVSVEPEVAGRGAKALVVVLALVLGVAAVSKGGG